MFGIAVSVIGSGQELKEVLSQIEGERVKKGNIHWWNEKLEGCAGVLVFRLNELQVKKETFIDIKDC